MHDNQSSAVRFWSQVTGLYRMMLSGGRVVVFFKEYLVFSVLSLLALYAVDMVLADGAYMQGLAHFSDLSRDETKVFLHRFWPFLFASVALWLLGYSVWGVIGMVRWHRWYLLQEEDRQWRWWFCRVDWMYLKRGFVVTLRIVLIYCFFSVIGLLLLIPLLDISESDVVLGISKSDVIGFTSSVIFGTSALYFSIRYGISCVAPALGEHISLKESIQRTKGQRWRYVGLLFVVSIIASLVAEGFRFIVYFYHLQSLMGCFFNAVFMALFTLVLSVMYQALPRQSENAEAVHA